MIRDFSDVCYHSYISIMDDLLHQEEGKRYEIRCVCLFVALFQTVYLRDLVFLLVFFLL